MKSKQEDYMFDSFHGNDVMPSSMKLFYNGEKQYSDSLISTEQELIHSNGGVNVPSTAPALTPCKKRFLPEIYGEKRMGLYDDEYLNINLLCRSRMKNTCQLLTEQDGCAHALKVVENIRRVTAYA